MTDATRRPAATLDSLTGLRFLAAMMVVAYHASLWSVHDHNPGRGPLEIGYVGVSFFFILSGFVLTWTHRPGDSPLDFWWRRVTRIYPVHLLTFALAVALLLSGLGDIHGTSDGWVAQLFLIQSWAPGPGALTYNAVAWSLSDEWFFYFLFPFLIGSRAVRRHPRLTAVLAGLWLLGGAVIVTVVDRRALGVLYWLPLYRIGEFLLGIALALALRRGWRPRIGLGAGVASAAAAYTAAWLWARAHASNLTTAFWYVQLITEGGFAVLILAAALTDIDRRPSPLRAPWLVRLGQWSFALYMLHELGMRLVYSAGARGERPWDFTAYLGVGLASIALAGAVHHWYERPIERRLRTALGPGRRVATRAT